MRKPTPPLTGTEVFFVQPDPSTAEGMHSLGSYAMQVPPRIHETVTIQAAFGSVPQRYVVQEVIHHMPPRSSTDVVAEVTCVVKLVVTDDDVNAVVAALCRNHFHDKPPKSPAPASAIDPRIVPKEM